VIILSKKKKNRLQERAKETMGLGITSMAGMGVMGTMTSIPGMPAAASGVAGVAGSGLTLLNVGQMAKNAMTITDMMTPENTKKKNGRKRKR